MFIFVFLLNTKPMKIQKILQLTSILKISYLNQAIISDTVPSSSV